MDVPIAKLCLEVSIRNLGVAVADSEASIK